MSKQDISDAVKESVAGRHQRVLDDARSMGLIGASKDARISGRVSSRLLDAARQRAQVSSDTELLELALSTLATEDDFGAKLVARRGRIPRDVDLEF